MERDTSFLRPEDQGKCEISRLYFKIMYPIETEHLTTTFGEFDIKQTLHELTKKKPRLLTKMSSEDGITEAVGNRRNSFLSGREGFEPSVQLPVHSISNRAL